MQAKPIKDKLKELEEVVSKMPLQVCWSTVLPEFGLQWREVARAVRNCRMAMVPASAARILSRHAARNVLDDDLCDIVARLQLKLTMMQDRKWYVIDLQEPIDEEISIGNFIQAIPSRIANALMKNRARQAMTPQVQTALTADLVYISVQLVSSSKQGAILYVATPLGQPVALVSSVTSSLLKGCVEGLGYRKYEDAQLFGRDILSLLRIHNPRDNADVDHLVSIPEYNPVPIVTNTGIDYTYNAYNEAYVDSLLGPDPPLLTDLVITSCKPFFDPSRMSKDVGLVTRLRSKDVGRTLKAWVAIGAISPTSDLFHIFRKVKSNTIEFGNADETSE